MTVHASKGLEFDHVFITGLEQGLFPSQRDNQKREDQEEERRLMYVAVTRAKKQLYLSHARLRRIYGEQEAQAPSEFLTDIPENLIDHLGDAGSPGGGEKTFYLDF
jgi:DNA helicase-2/ATP-dependent DNA helicase PcrA